MFSPPAAVDVQIGARVGPYRLERRVGEGTMSTVYLASRGTSERQVAVKLARRGFELHRLRRRFRCEEEALARLDHPDIPRFHATGTLPDGRPYLVMELVDGEPIDAWCERSRLALRARAELFAAVCSVVEHVHRHGLIHRDLKPVNILVTGEGAPRLLDFGSALRRGEDDPDPAAADRPMTPHYASPEQIRGETLGPVSDVYSLGVVLYRLLAGRLPYGDDAASPGPREMARLLEAGPPPPPGAGRRLDGIVLEALVHDPSRRTGSAAALAAALRRHLDASG